ncbi:hypothetical protein PsYK624_155050 [Phanerochaete sordida]|uniref:Uncharacterized protein n=1 Tax=Phanerochaete sordida TaxID=48140 RepID=A0A9P3GT84_9APHY|nr:hypothetical protein PsYK624_155050 [Phanerochaete sordida]
MNFVIENEGKPVPDLASVSTRSSSQPSANAGEYENKELAVLNAGRRRFGGTPSGCGGRRRAQERQVLRVRQDLHEHHPAVPYQEQRARLARGVERTSQAAHERRKKQELTEPREKMAVKAWQEAEDH